MVACSLGHGGGTSPAVSLGGAGAGGTNNSLVTAGGVDMERIGSNGKNKCLASVVSGILTTPFRGIAL
uniref:Uncharacterized protein n=1 Tax=Oryza barthii TaxID=65489 RepID=A0A0D3HJJ8_9ORYZ